MAYATYTTKAIVCGSKASHTSDKSYLLFTEEAGMLWATARSVREEKSKQRYALQDFSLIRVSLVRGKGGWRIGSVEAIDNAFMRAGTQAARAGITTVINLLRRFLHGEETQPVVFADTLVAMQAIGTVPDESIGLLTDRFTLRLLYHLGYIARHKEYDELLAGDTWQQEPSELPGMATRAIERGLEVSHL